MKHMKIPDKLIRLTQIMVNVTQAKLKYTIHNKQVQNLNLMLDSS
jgi:hypothetical protein